MAIHQGEILKRLIDNQSVPNEEIAKLADIAISSLYNYYNLEEIPSRKLKMICEVLQVDYISTFIQPAPRPYGFPPLSNNVLNDDGGRSENIYDTPLSNIYKLLKQVTEQNEEILKMLKKKNKA